MWVKNCPRKSYILYSWCARTEPKSQAPTGSKHEERTQRARSRRRKSSSQSSSFSPINSCFPNILHWMLVSFTGIKVWGIQQDIYYGVKRNWAFQHGIILVWFSSFPSSCKVRARPAFALWDNFPFQFFAFASVPSLTTENLMRFDFLCQTACRLRLTIKFRLCSDNAMILLCTACFPSNDG